jgi:hypothetical protein
LVGGYSSLGSSDPIHGTDDEEAGKVSKLILVGVWVGVAVLSVNTFFVFQVMTELQSDEEPISVAVDWENQEVVIVDIAAVSNGTDEGVEGGFIPVWTPYVVASETGEGEYLDLPTRVQNTVAVGGDRGCWASGV